MKTTPTTCSFALGLLLLALAADAHAALGTPDDPVPDSPYYKVHPLFHPYPDGKKTWTVTHFGPVGIGLDLVAPSFTMRIRNVEEGSPAGATGKLKPGQIIQSINGKTLRDVDPRILLGDFIAEAEATDGVLRMMVKDRSDTTAQGVIVTIPVLGAYSETWPVNCPKSDRIVRNLADRLAEQETPKWGSLLFLLSTGEERDLDVVRGWMKDFSGVGSYPWSNGMLGPGVCEYYLRTGDARVLPVIKQMTDVLREQIYCGGWSGRGKASFTYMAGGHLNAAGVHCLTFLLLARQCGVEVDEHTLQTSLRHFYRYAGRGNVAYGDHWPEGGFRDNGKTGGLAVAMAAAAQLTPEGESSLYARARDNCAIKSFYATTWFMLGHTGGGIGELWHNVAMGLMPEKRPVQYRSFMDERRWVMDLSRRFDGSIGISGGERYDKSATEDSDRSWGTYFALAYTAPRKKLRLFGAPRTQWCKTYPLPERPWGTPADDVFCSNEPVEYRPGRVQDLSEEEVPTDASWPILRRIGDPEASDDTLMMYAHHPEFGVRVGAMRTIVNHGRDHLIVPLLRSSDPRMRHAGLLAISGMFKGHPLPADRVTDEMFDLVGKMLDDPDESWWVAQEAMRALARAPAERIAAHVDRLVSFLAHDDWWLHTTAMAPLTTIATDDRFYKRLLPLIADVVRNGRAFPSTNPVGTIARSVQDASPAVQELALSLFGDAYAALPDPVIAPGGQITPNQTEVLRGRAYSFLQTVPGGAAAVLALPKLTSRWQATGKEEDKYVHDDTFVPNQAILGRWTVIDQVKAIDEFTYDKDKNAGQPPFGNITFMDQGKTDNDQRIWTGTTLIDLSRWDVQEMTIEQIEVPPPPDVEGPGMDLTLDPEGDLARELAIELDREDAKKTGKVPTAPYLFIEVGGFGGSKPEGWKTPYYVLEKQE